MIARRLRKETEAQFTITYDGPAVEAGRMDAQDLGAAMLSVARLIETSTALTYGATAHIEVDVVGDFQAGSFSFEVVTAAADTSGVIKQLLDSLDMGHVLAILGITGGGGLIGLIAWLRNRKVKSVEPQENNNVRVETEDGDSMIVNGQTVVLFQNSTVRLHLDGVVAPLRKEGVTEFRSGRGQVETVVRADQVEYFEPPRPEGDILQDRVTREIVQIVGVVFQQGRKWRFRLPDGTAFNSALDDAFTKLVLGHAVVFGAGDALEVDLHTIVVRDRSGELHAQREIVRVERLLPAPKQFNLLPDQDAP